MRISEDTITTRPDAHGLAVGALAGRRPGAAPVVINPSITYLERMIAGHEINTRQHQFARAKLSAMLGDIAAASASLRELLQQYDDRLCDDDISSATPFKSRC